jgi:hypothetical protein
MLELKVLGEVNGHGDTLLARRRTKVGFSALTTTGCDTVREFHVAKEIKQ